MPKGAVGNLLIACLLLASVAPVSAQTTRQQGRLVLQSQGSFAVGGTIITDTGTFDPIKHGAFNPANQSSAGQTLHGDHAYVFYQIPKKARKLPLVLWHGFGQSAKTWETTPDGREGFQNIFLRRHFPVYLVDQPRRGRAARSTKPITIPAAPDEQLWFGIFRMGIGTDFFPGVQFSKEPEALNQFYRQMVPNTGPFDLEVNTDAVSALFDKIGQGILVTHSHSGGQGWTTATKNKNIKAIVSYEPGSGFLFPQGEVPEPISYLGGRLQASEVPMSDFMKLTKIPIVIYYGDYISNEPSKNPGQDQWRASFAMAKLWRDAVNKHGGDVTLVYLPEAGLKGNTHFPMSDLNNVQVAGLMSKWLKEKGLDQ
ncbi:MAG TPA: alpha/beta fold hydrolase [Sphingobacteriaceae bacterium]